MAGKKYILTVVETESNKAYSAYISRRRVVMIVMAITAGLCAVAFPIAGALKRAQGNYQFQQLQRENAVLKGTFASWEERMTQVQSMLEDLGDRSHLLQGTDKTLPDIEYGKGGPGGSSAMDVLEYPDLKKSELNLSRLEAEIDWFRGNMAEMEQKIAAQAQQISHYPSIRPLPGGWYSSGFGERNDPFTQKRVHHPGLDISSPEGTDVYATADGVVQAIRTTFVKNKGYGKYVIVDHGYGFETLYAHLSRVLVRKGQRVKRWDVIGKVGDTGKSTSPHLHYGVAYQGEYQDPMNYILDDQH